jgi:hypothetical protein
MSDKTKRSRRRGAETGGTKPEDEHERTSHDERAEKNVRLYFATGTDCPCFAHAIYLLICVRAVRASLVRFAPHNTKRFKTLRFAFDFSSFSSSTTRLSS